MLAMMSGCGGGSSAGNHTTTTLSASATNVTVGTVVIFTASVTPANASGAVNFHDGTIALGASILGSGTATIQVNNLAVGTHAITATYAGDNTHETSTSIPVTVTVR